MGDKTKIEWTDKTFNLAIGCVMVSEGCHFCYAAKDDKRKLYSPDLHWGPLAPRYQMADGYWKQPARWNRRAARDGVKFKVFCSSTCDVFEDHPVLAIERQKLWELIPATPNLIWQLLTKRPQNILRMIPKSWANNGLPDNVWAMTSAENQARFDERVPHLRNVPAKIRGFSCEPLLSAIEIQRCTRWTRPQTHLGDCRR
jgi:protein gp37